MLLQLDSKEFIRKFTLIKFKFPKKSFRIFKKWFTKNRKQEPVDGEGKKKLRLGAERVVLALDRFPFQTGFCFETIFVVVNRR